MKYQIHFCEQCARCRDPKLYCKHRTACIIWFNTKLCGLTGTGATGGIVNGSMMGYAMLHPSYAYADRVNL